MKALISVECPFLVPDGPHKLDTLELGMGRALRLYNRDQSSVLAMRNEVVVMIRCHSPGFAIVTNP